MYKGGLMVKKALSDKLLDTSRGKLKADKEVYKVFDVITRNILHNTHTYYIYKNKKKISNNNIKINDDV